MKQSKLVAWLVLLCCCSAGNAAGTFEGTDLHNELKAYARIERGAQEVGDYQLSGHGVGYVQALGDIIIVQGGACPRSPPRTAQLVAIVTTFLDEHPDQWNEPAFLSVGEAIHNAFPCVQPDKAGK